jgi:hypothetical protein
MNTSLGRATRRGVRWMIALLVMGAPLAAAVTTATRGAPIPLSLGSGSELWLEGTSTLHEYQSRTKELRLTMARDSAEADPAGTDQLIGLVQASKIRAVDVEVPVKSLHSPKGAGLDKNLWKALQADTHPTIRFRLDHYTLTPHATAGDTIPIRADGFLTVAGQERPVSMDAVAYHTPGGLGLAGHQALRMSEFGIRPPTMMLGTLRVDDRVTVHYRLLLVAGSH